MAKAPSGYCKEFYEKGLCRYKGACKFAHVRNEGFSARTCPGCGRSSEEMCVSDCGHVFCLECSIHGFSHGGRCGRCGEETEGRFFVL